MNNPLVSVIIPCYNLGAYVAETVESAQNQLSVQKEIILVDDGSTDGETVSLLDKLGAMDNVRLIRTENRGVASARNRGMAESRGDYICFLDADDRLEPEALLKMATRLDKNSDSVLAYPSGYTFGNREGAYWRPQFNRLRFLTACTLPVPGLIRKSMLNGCRFRTADRGFEYEDWDFFIQVTRLGKAIHVPQMLYGYRERTNSRVDAGASHHDEVIEDMRRFNPKDYAPGQLMELKRQWAPAVSIETVDEKQGACWKKVIKADPALDASVNAGAKGKYLLSCSPGSLINAASLRQVLQSMEEGEAVDLPKGWNIHRAPGLEESIDPVAGLAEMWVQTNQIDKWAELDERLWRLTLPAWTKEGLPKDVDELAGPLARICGVLSRMKQAGVKEYGLFGGGKHPSYLLHKGWFEQKPNVIFDDFPKVESIDGIPVVKPDEESLGKIDTLLVCSDAYEKVLYKRAMELSQGRIPVLRIYS